MAAAAASRHQENVKVVLIDTQYVETDPHSFKSVVQKLTGKDSCVAWIDEKSFGGNVGIIKKQKKDVAVQNRTTAAPNQIRSCGGAVVGSGGAMLSKGLSFKDLDRMILEAPPVDELRWLWAD
ncbi:VQ motif-containing protein [Corchorus capsularis]|uniref:VQ motif-containing protein n=1 Tax=Corchorus capsularis TaxID=210143 RepID=A0A1R3HJ18_COCAP|nr:VQ motif-containing protein [Corchorus capsularis]